jgi:signal transduction histidine kinase/HAMP domain-containing protein
MLRLRDLTIRQKLMAITMIEITAITVSAITVFVALEQIDSRRSLVKDLLSHAEMLADNCKASLAFDHKQDAEQILSTLRFHASAVLVRICDRQGSAFAEYKRNDISERVLHIKHQAGTPVLEDGFISVSQKIVLDGEVIGSIELVDDMSGPRNDLKWDIAVGTVIMAAALMLGYLLSSKLQTMISRPILDLARVAGEISEKQDYSVRARESSHDEVGYLTGVFNTMLEQIQQRDSELSSARDKLEIRVGERTAELALAYKRTEGLNRLKGNLLSFRDLSKKLKCITDTVVETFDADFARIWLIKQGDRCDSGCVHAEAKEGPHVCRYRDRCLHLMVSSGRYTHIDGETHRRVPFGCYKIGRIAADEGTKFLTNDVTHDPRVHNHDWAGDLGLVSFVGYRLVSTTGEPMGVLALFSKHVISDEEDSLLEGVTNTTSQVIQIAMAQEELENMHQSLIVTSHQAGMAEVAADVLHNVGNVLNSINVSTTLITGKVTNSEVANLEKVARIVNEHIDEIGTFLTEHPQGKHIPVYLTEVSKCLHAEQTDIIEKLQVLTDNVQHIKDIISMQQAYAKVSAIEVQISPARLVEDAIRINSAGLQRHGTRLVREFEELPDVEIDKQRVLQILVNLISNAKYALSDSKKRERLVTVRICKPKEGRFRIEVADNGVGIPEENLTRIFSHGFTTKEGGHGFGLHGSALAAKELGGSLTVHSDGVEQGATFTLELPFKPAKVTS